MVKVTSRYSAGFTLLELMVAVAVAGILATIALQAYGSYVVSSKLSESFSMLSDYRLKMEQFKQDNRSYADSLNPNACGVAPPSTNRYFSFGCVIAASGTQYTATASNQAGAGLGKAADYSYSIDQDGIQNTPAFAGAPGPAGSWKNK
ncbi:fimbrial protein precursor [mine drainage metagenome]|uniref:Fimbrial protein n=1 Tax=mine drainage metagenome TaxID=410659 RepID=A0A1J5TI28_9ZZZZ